MVVAIHIGIEGRVHQVDILQSAGGAFDAAAVKVARLMRFSPAATAEGPIPAKLKQRMVFSLRD